MMQRGLAMCRVYGFYFLVFVAILLGLAQSRHVPSVSAAAAEANSSETLTLHKWESTNRHSTTAALLDCETTDGSTVYVLS